MQKNEISLTSLRLYWNDNDEVFGYDSEDNEYALNYNGEIIPMPMGTIDIMWGGCPLDYAMELQKKRMEEFLAKKKEEEKWLKDVALTKEEFNKPGYGSLTEKMEEIGERIDDARRRMGIVISPPESIKIVRKIAPFNYVKSLFIFSRRFDDYQKWEIELLEAVIFFRKKFNKWPNTMITSEQTYNRIEETLENEMEEEWPAHDLVIIEVGNPDFEIEEMYDWEDLNPDMNISDIEKLDLNRIPVSFGEKIEGPFFSIELLVDDRCKGNMFRLIFDEGLEK